MNEQMIGSIHASGLKQTVFIFFQNTNQEKAFLL